MVALSRIKGFLIVYCDAKDYQRKLRGSLYGAVALLLGWALASFYVIDALQGKDDALLGLTLMQMQMPGLAGSLGFVLRALLLRPRVSDSNDSEPSTTGCTDTVGGAGPFAT